MLPSQALLLLCHYNHNDLVIIIYTVVHDLRVNLTCDFFFLMVPQCGPGPS